VGEPAACPASALPGQRARAARVAYSSAAECPGAEALPAGLPVARPNSLVRSLAAAQSAHPASIRAKGAAAFVESAHRAQPGRRANEVNQLVEHQPVEDQLVEHQALRRASEVAAPEPADWGVLAAGEPADAVGIRAPKPPAHLAQG